MKKADLLYVVLFMCMITPLFSKHIVGGELIYDQLSVGKYRLTLKLYRDCGDPTAANFDGLPNSNSSISQALITVYTGNDSLIGLFNIGAPIVTNVPPTINNPCIQTPAGGCVQEGIYTFTLSLPPRVGGYYVTYQRCCRNNAIDNLVSSGNQGSSYHTIIPGLEVSPNNSSPRFKSFPPIFICNNIQYTFDHSAVDPDGDQLVYSFFTSFQGLSPNCPSFNNSGCPSNAPPQPYQIVNYSSGYSSNYPIASNPAFSINPSTGILAGKPTLQGTYVICICVKEYRNGVLLNTHFRDFQFNVSACVINVLGAIADQSQQCQGLTATFNNQSINQSINPSFHWDFGDPTVTTDTSSIFSPSYTYADTGTYIVTLVVNPGKTCNDTVKKTIYIYPVLDINYSPPATQCLNNNSFNFNVNGVYDPSANFTWTFGSASTPSVSVLKNPSGVIFNQAGTHLVKLLATQFACRDSFIDTIRVISRPVAKINNLPASWCDPAIVAFSNGSSSDLPVSYQWIFSNGNVSNDIQPIQVFSPPGVYSATLIATTNTLCVDTSVAVVNNVTVHPTPKAGFIFSPTITTIFDPEITFTNTASGNVVNWQYNFGDGGTSAFMNELHVYQQYGDYVITQTVSNQFNCTDTISKVLRILPEFRFWIPNCFTPDANLLNDYFMPIAIGVINYEFEVFDRWGEKIFSTKNPLEGWNGYYRGKECKEDVYVWRIVFKNVVSSKDEIHYGHVTLLKNK